MQSKGVERGETASRILDIATDLIQTRGYCAFSYHDIAEQLGIRKASVHYHFPTKADLGLAVIIRYSETFRALLDALLDDRDIGTEEALRRYCEPFVLIADSHDKVCLCAALAGEIRAMPDEMQVGVGTFFDEHQRWITTILERGLKRGEIRLRASAPTTARMIFASLQGAVLVCRATRSPAPLEDAIAALLAGISNG